MEELMENGPSNYNGEAGQVWERPWTLDEMRKSSADWSLAADSGLCLYMQNFSQWMLSKTHEIEKQLDGLIRDTKATDSCLHTVFNDFLMLSNIQFIENRVYDEEVEDPSTKPEVQEKRPEQEKSREQKEAELIPKVQEAVNYGLKVLESAFEQLDIKVGNSDSEDEEAPDRVDPILEPKDLYVDRPLPCLIGSQAFMEQDDVGLGDLSSDEMSIDSERDIESDEGKDEDEHSDEDFDQEEEGQVRIKKKPSVASYDEEDEENEDSDLFGESDKDDDDSRIGDVGPTSFADELAARIKGEATNKPEADRASLASANLPVSKKKIKGKKLPESRVQDDDNDDDDLFKPPDMEADEFSPFGGKGGLFSGGKGLFDDDDEGDLFSETSKKDMVTEQTTSQTESEKTRKIPTGAVSIFPGSSLPGSQNGSEPFENKENSSALKPKVQAAPEQESLGGGLFDESDDEDFFIAKTPKKTTTGSQEKPKPTTTKDLFGGDEDDDEDVGIFSTGSQSAFLQQNKKSVDDEKAVRPPEKKLPAGAVSMFGPGTQNLLGDSLKKHQPTAIEDSMKSDKSAPHPDVPKPSTAPKPAEKSQNKGLFSEEDSKIFPSISKSQSKPEFQTQKITSKATLSIFDDDDDEEEDLFASVPKSESIQDKTAAPKLKKTVSSSLFSDDEDQWVNDKPASVTPELKSGGMKASISAPSRLHSTKQSQKSSLFDDDQRDDLFAATKESSQKKPQRVSLLFEDEDDEAKGSLFGFKPPAKIGTPDVKAPSLFGPEDNTEVASVLVEKVAEEKPLEKKTLQTTSTPDESNKNKKPHGVVDLFEGINVLEDGPKSITTKNDNYLDNEDDLEWHKEAPPPMDSKEKKTKKNTFSLFDEDDEDDDDDKQMGPFSTATKPSDKNTKAQEQKASVRSTGVFQDEELLFSQTQQRDNDPEVDLFATSAKPSAPLASSVKPAAPTLFGEDDDDDDLFSTAKPKAPPKVPAKTSKPKYESVAPHSAESEKPASAVKPKETSSRIGKLQATLAINPTSLMPGAGLRIPGAVSVLPGLTHSPSPRAAGLTVSELAAEGGVSFETPAQTTMLQNANKDRVRGATRRRPQTRAARQLAAQRSEERHVDNHEERAQAASGASTTSSLPSFNPDPVRPSALTLPVTTSTTTAPTQTASDEVVRSKIVPVPEDDFFLSKDLFATAPVAAPTPSTPPKAKPSESVSNGGSKKKDPALAIFDDHSDDLFTKVKPKPVKKNNTMPFLNDNEEEEGDIFGTDNKESKTSANSSNIDIFQDEKQAPSKVRKKPKDQSLDASLFDDNVDIFANLTLGTKPKVKKAMKKVETKSIFDDDMDDIFSSGLSKPVLASSSKKSKKPVQESSSPEESGHSIFDDPLNVLGGN